jgi:hypothetical protein
LGKKYLASSILLSLLSIAGCASDQGASTLATTTMTIGSKTYTVEIANTSATEERGLMRRDSMPADHGMIFVFSTPQQAHFWMKNTRFDLDIVYITADGHVDSIRHMKAYDRSDVPSDGPVKWAVELNAGQPAENGVKVGDVITIPESAREMKE